VNAEVGVRIVLGIFAIVAATISYWILAPGDVLVIHNGPVPIRPTTITAGSSAILAYDYCKNSDTAGTLKTSVISARTELLVPETAERSPKACAKIDVPIIIPPQAVPDTYHFHFKAVYRLNPFRQITVEWDSMPFTVQ
jgi:hypothetical protein